MVMVTVMVMAKRMRPEAVEEVGKIIGLTGRKLADCERTNRNGSIHPGSPNTMKA